MCWLYIAADKNMAKAQVQLGFLSLMYDQSERHNDDAESWFQRAAGQFDLIGQVMVSQMLRDGIGAAQKPNLQALWMDKAIAQAAQIRQLSGQTKQQLTDFLVKLASTARAASELPVTKETEYFNRSDLLTKQIICAEGFDRYCVSGINAHNDWQKGISQARSSEAAPQTTRIMSMAMMPGSGGKFFRKEYTQTTISYRKRVFVGISSGQSRVMLAPKRDLGNCTTTAKSKTITSTLPTGMRKQRTMATISQQALWSECMPRVWA